MPLSMEKKINILHLEDSYKDAEIIREIVESGGSVSGYFVVDNEKDYLAVLEKESIDLILSDYSLPDFNGNEALKVVRRKCAKIPFIFVSGAIGEDTAIEAMVNGATDYVFKDKLERLIPAINRANHEQEQEINRRLAEKKLKEKTELLVSQNEKYIQINNELLFQKEEKIKRANELLIANEELAFQNLEKKKRADELVIANNELAFQNIEKEKRAAELIIANKELQFQNEEKEKRANELIIANEELTFQNEEKEKRAAELILANKELAFQNEEKEKRAAELDIANKELHYQNEEKEKRASELIIAKEKAEESDKLKTAFLQNMSHEIRTPLNGIIGFSSLLNYEDISREEIKEYSAIISQSGNRLIEIVNNVLDISKIETGQIVIEQKAIVIDEIFADLLTFFTPVARTKKIRLEYANQGDKTKMIYSDEAKLHQILTNLINNAVKFTKSGSIDFGFETKGNIIQFYVKDTGIGIPAELHDKVFIRFIQAEQSMTKNYEGAGLGLAISKGLVELLGGKIWVESEIGMGTTFFFTLPDATVKEHAKTEKIFTEVQGKESQRKILIAEDDWTSFQYLSKMLSKSKVSIIHAENGEQAVEFAKTIPDIDLILMDIRMPVMNGIDAARLIKQIRPDLPIIAQTAYAFSEEKTTILSTGFDEYLSKPLQYSKLNELIKKYLN